MRAGRVQPNSLRLGRPYHSDVGAGDAHPNRGNPKCGLRRSALQTVLTLPWVSEPDKNWIDGD